MKFLINFLSNCKMLYNKEENLGPSESKITHTTNKKPTHMIQTKLSEDEINPAEIINLHGQQ